MKDLVSIDPISEASLLVRQLKPKYPVDAQWFASQVFNKPVEIYKWDLDEKCCAVIVDKPYYEFINIAVNKNHPERKQRFGVFHEMAHICLNHRGNLSFIEEEEDPVLRKEADDFATEILMPQYYVMQLAARANSPIQLVRNVYIDCKVSFEAASRRIIELGLYRGIFLMFNFKQLFFTYKSNHFISEMGAIKKILQPECTMLPKGKVIQREVIYRGEYFTLHICRFRTTGTFLAALVEDNPAKRYDLLVQNWLRGVGG